MLMIRNTGIGKAIIVSTALLIFISGCARKKSEEESSIQAAVVPVKITAVRTGNMDESVQANGQTEALRKESFVSPVAGRISELMAQEGQNVKAGDTLAVILTRESLSALEGAQALLDRAKTPGQKAEAERALKLAETNQNRVVIKSQISGVVVARNVAEGAMVTENAELLSIIDPQSINFAAQVPLKELVRIKIGQDARVRLSALPKSALEASVSAINPQADSSNQTARVLLRFYHTSNDGPVNFANGMAGTAEIIIGEHENVMIVPLAAVLRNDETNTYTIVTMTPDSLSKTISVTPGITQDSTMEIASSELREGIPVIIEGNYALPDSTRVTVGQQESK
jgi:membrane fusion protein, multidrug efflux system